MRSGVSSMCTCGMAARRAGMPERYSYVSMRIWIGADGCFCITDASFLDCKRLAFAPAFLALSDCDARGGIEGKLAGKARRPVDVGDRADQPGREGLPHQSDFHP